MDLRIVRCEDILTIHFGLLTYKYWYMSKTKTELINLVGWSKIAFHQQNLRSF